MKKSIDMLHGALWKKIIAFAMPIAASSMFQQFFNMADTAVVGRFADANALAAVGTNGEIVGLLVSMSLGLAMGANVLLARFIGANKKEKISEALHSSIMLALIIGVVIAVIGVFISQPVLEAIHTPDTVLPLAVMYLKIYFAGYPALLLYDFGSSILRAKGDSRRPFIILMLSGVINVIFNLFFVIVCRLGVAGVAIATDISTIWSAVCVLGILTKEEEEFRLHLRKIRIHKQHVLDMLKIGVPAALQLAVFCFANIFVQAAVNGFGAVVTAGSAIAMNFEYFGYYVITAFGQTATTFTSQNYAAGNKKRCHKILLECLIYSILFSSAVIVPLTVFRSGASGLFSSDAAVIEQSCVRIMLILILEPMCGLYEVPAGYLRGRGYSSVPAVITIIGTCMLRIVWIETVFRYMNTLSSLYVVFPVSWVVTSVLMWVAYFVIERRRRADF